MIPFQCPNCFGRLVKIDGNIYQCESCASQVAADTSSASQVTVLQCPSCLGKLFKFDNDIYQCESCGSQVKIKNETPNKFDIYICAKTTDKDNGINHTKDYYFALKLYEDLTFKGYKVFFAPVSMSSVSSNDYDAHIMSALNTAKIMILYGTNTEYINSIWVRSEWEYFMRRITKGSASKNSLILCHDNIDLSKLPPALSVLPRFDVSNLRFVTDLNNLIADLMISEVNPSNRIMDEETLLAMGMSNLKAKEFESAESNYNEVIKLNPNNGEAMWSLLLAKQKVISNSQLLDNACNLTTSDAVLINKAITKIDKNNRMEYAKLVYQLILVLLDKKINVCANLIKTLHLLNYDLTPIKQRFIDAVMNCRSDIGMDVICEIYKQDEVIELLLQFVSLCIENEEYQLALNYNMKILILDPNNSKAIWNKMQISFYE